MELPVRPVDDFGFEALLFETIASARNQVSATTSSGPLWSEASTFFRISSSARSTLQCIDVWQAAIMFSRKVEIAARVEDSGLCNLVSLKLQIIFGPSWFPDVCESTERIGPSLFTTGAGPDSSESSKGETLRSTQVRRETLRSRQVRGRNRNKSSVWNTSSYGSWTNPKICSPIRRPNPNSIPAIRERIQSSQSIHDYSLIVGNRFLSLSSIRMGSRRIIFISTQKDGIAPSEKYLWPSTGWGFGKIGNGNVE